MSQSFFATRAAAALPPADVAVASNPCMALVTLGAVLTFNALSALSMPPNALVATPLTPGIFCPIFGRIFKPLTASLGSAINDNPRRKILLTV